MSVTAELPAQTAPARIEDDKPESAWILAIVGSSDAVISVVKSHSKPEAR